MTVQIIDGYDMYNGVVANTGLQAKWTPAGTAGLTMQAGRFGGQAAQWVEAASTRGPGTHSLPANLTTVGVGFALRMTVMPTAAGVNPFVQLLSGANFQIGVAARSNGSLDFYRLTSLTAGTLLGSSAAGVILANTWHFIEINSVISDTVGTAVVKVDGVTVINLAAQDTNNSGANVNVIAFQTGANAGTTATYQIDDLYVVDTATLGERRIETLYPSADTAQKDFTPNSGVTNFSRVNEAQVDGDTTYVQASVVGNTDRYDFGDLTGAPATIDAVQISAFAEKTDATARSIALQAKSGATTSDGANFALAASYAKLERLLTTDPNGGGAWSAAAVNALQAGPKVTV